MLSYFSDELIWALSREREEEVRRIRPHTERRAQPDRTSPPEDRARRPWRPTPSLPALRRLTSEH
jgi:hypothetical protein